MKSQHLNAQDLLLEVFDYSSLSISVVTIENVALAKKKKLNKNLFHYSLTVQAHTRIVT